MSPPAAPQRELSAVLVLAGAFCVAVVVGVFWWLDGWEYYRAPLAGRGYMAGHRMLRPSGYVGLPLGVAGMVAMVFTLPYAARKRWQPLSRFGRTSKWLEVHIFFGIVGPVLVTLHTSFKFNGIIAVGYWLMMTVWASGFVGRYLYVRIAKAERQAGGRNVHLERLRRTFELWHVFHRPLVYAMFGIVGLHVAIAAYLGYAQLLLGR